MDSQIYTKTMRFRSSLLHRRFGTEQSSCVAIARIPWNFGGTSYQQSRRLCRSSVEPHQPTLRTVGAVLVHASAERYGGSSDPVCRYRVHLPPALIVLRLLLFTSPSLITSAGFCEATCKAAKFSTAGANSWACSPSTYPRPKPRPPARTWRGTDYPRQQEIWASASPRHRFWASGIPIDL